MFAPLTKTVPLVGVSNAPTMLNIVVLPDPEGPMMDKYSPRITLRFNAANRACTS